MSAAKHKIVKGFPVLLILLALAAIPGAVMVLRLLAEHPWIEAGALGGAFAVIGGLLFIGVSSWAHAAAEERRSRQLLAGLQSRSDDRFVPGSVPEQDLRGAHPRLVIYGSR